LWLKSLAVATFKFCPIVEYFYAFFVPLYEISAGLTECVRVHLTAPPAYTPTCLSPIFYTGKYGSDFRLHFIFWIQRKIVGEFCPTSCSFQVYIRPSRFSPVFAETAFCTQLVHSLVSLVSLLPCLWFSN